MLTIKLFSISILALILLLSMGSIASADGSQSWYLTNTAASLHADDGTLHACDNIMRKLEQTGGSKIGPIVGSSTAWWYSESATECDVAFGEKKWSLELNLDGFGWGNVRAQVWSVDESGHMERLLAEGMEHINWGFYPELTIECYDYEPTQQTVLKDHRLALRLIFKGLGFASLFTCAECFGTGILYSPETDPGFPLPELPAIALLASGLGCLAGYVVLRRWKTGAILAKR
jgi:hypothetical protein